MLAVPVRKVGQDAAAPPGEQEDLVAVEEPLQIRMNGRDVAVTMRTPGHDDELAAGFLFTEGVIGGRADIAAIECGENVATVRLAPESRAEAGGFERHFYMTSSCGVCGKASMDAIAAAGCTSLEAGVPAVDAAVIRSLPDRLRPTQPVFERTGGLHAAALFDSGGALVGVREDVGRHNAVDKLVGRAVLDGQVPLSWSMLLVSGRASFELVQKALRGGIPILCAVGAPSSLAVETALRFGMTLVGFLRGGRFNVYAGEGRIQFSRQGTPGRTRR
jgi:FdhD protein